MQKGTDKNKKNVLIKKPLPNRKWKELKMIGYHWNLKEYIVLKDVLNAFHLKLVTTQLYPLWRS